MELNELNELMLSIASDKLKPHIYENNSDEVIKSNEDLVFFIEGIPNTEFNEKVLLFNKGNGLFDNIRDFGTYFRGVYSYYIHFNPAVNIVTLSSNMHQENELTYISKFRDCMDEYPLEELLDDLLDLKTKLSIFKG